jgi:hypothetical protein
LICHAASGGAAPAPPEAPALDKFTVALFHFDERAGDAVSDAVAGEAPGRKGDAAQWAPTAGNKAGALRLLPRAESAQTLPIVAWTAGKSNDVFTVDFLMKFSRARLDHDFYIVSSGNVFFRYAADRDAFEFGVQTSKGWTTCAAPKGEFRPNVDSWCSVAGSYDGADLRLFLDGKPVATSPAHGTVAFDSLLLGGLAWDVKNTGVDFDGWIDELRISNIPRTEFPVG